MNAAEWKKLTTEEKHGYVYTQTRNKRTCADIAREVHVGTTRIVHIKTTAELRRAKSMLSQSDALVNLAKLVAYQRNEEWATLSPGTQAIYINSLIVRLKHPMTGADLYAMINAPHLIADSVPWEQAPEEEQQLYIAALQTFSEYEQQERADMAEWEDYQQTGEAIPNSQVTPWLEQLAEGKRVPWNE